MGGQGIVGHVAATGATVNLDDAYESPLFDQSYDKASGYKTGSVLAMPIYSPSAEIIGVLECINKHGKPSRFTGEDEQMLKAFALHVSVALNGQGDSFDAVVQTFRQQ